MQRSTSAIHRLPPQKVRDPDLIAIRAKLFNAFALKASALVTPPATNLSPPYSHAGPHPGPNPGPGPSGTTQRSRSRSRHRRAHRHPKPRVVVGPDTIHRLPSELARLHLSSPLIVSSPSRLNLARKIQAIIPNLDSRVLSSAVATLPSHVSSRDCVVSVGGGSAVTLARAVGLRNGIPHICIPTTYSGSELHPGAGRNKSTTEEEAKTLPAVIIYDDNLTMSSPTRFSAPSDDKVMEDFARADQAPKSEDAGWSYLHIPGV
ncbi:maleylacetate reductase [Fusarium longipes]|uniref:Maleylacetate reductase n=1 Tax=Fusarium longipes TaxID=694270 RepID=A0A395SHT7_9HYPO|nr:maleylacetate reductase [Fusarium longipes]